MKKENRNCNFEKQKNNLVDYLKGTTEVAYVAE
jgi:hypothetical protein